MNEPLVNYKSTSSSDEEGNTKEFLKVPWPKDNIKTFLEQRQREIELAINSGGIKSRLVKVL